MYYFKRNTETTIETEAGLFYKPAVYPDVAISQVYSEEELKKKTLHNPENFISDGFTSILNVGNFSITTPLLEDDSTEILLTSLLAIGSKHSIYVTIGNKVLKLHTCTVNNIVFNIGKNELITLSISGSFSHGEEVVSLPAGTAFNYAYSSVEGIQIDTSVGTLDQVNSFSLEISNESQWLNNNTMHSNAPIHRTNFYNQERIISGNFSRSTDIELPTYNDSSILRVQVQGRNQIILDFDFPRAMLVTRLQMDDIIKTGYDFRVTGNQLNEIKYKGVNVI